MGRLFGTGLALLLLGAVALGAKSHMNFRDNLRDFKETAHTALVEQDRVGGDTKFDDFDYEFEQGHNCQNPGHLNYVGEVTVLDQDKEVGSLCFGNYVEPGQSWFMVYSKMVHRYNYDVLSVR